jgi:hypothetical protein
VAPQNDTADRKIARIATRAHGVVTWREMRRADVTAAEIRHRAASGALIREYRGVYRVGHQAPSREARYMAAVRAAGPGCVLCGRAAGHVHGLVKGRPPPPEVTSRRTRVDRRDRTLWNGIPCTTVPRTLVDLAGLLTLDELMRACHEAAVTRGVRPHQVDRVLARRPNAKGAATLRAVLHGDAPTLLSQLETGFFHRLRASGLPLPDTNRRVDDHCVDCRWAEYGVTVELVSYRFHHTRHAWERDQERQRAARARGDDFRTYTWGDVFETWPRTERELRAALRAEAA